MHLNIYGTETMKKLKLALLSALSMLMVASTATAATNLSIKSRSGDDNNNTQIGVELELWNNSSSSVSLNDVTIRYYFSGAGKDYTGSIWYYDAAGTKPKIRCSAELYTSNYCDIIFDKNAPTLSGYNAVSIEAVFKASQYVTENTSDDHSNSYNSFQFLKNDKMVVYKNSELVWGSEPTRGPQKLRLYSFDDRGGNGYILNPSISISNYYHNPVDTKSMKVVYYFHSNQPASSYTAEMWYDNAPGGTPQVACKDLAAPLYNRTKMANKYCEVTFPYGGDLSYMGGMKIDFGIWNGYYHSQAYDWSWNGTTSQSNSQIVIYKNGTIFWGEEPR